jgi:hypothetical protein
MMNWRGHRKYILVHLPVYLMGAFSVTGYVITSGRIQQIMNWDKCRRKQSLPPTTILAFAWEQSKRQESFQTKNQTSDLANMKQKC